MSVSISSHVHWLTDAMVPRPFDSAAGTMTRSKAHSSALASACPLGCLDFDGHTRQAELAASNSACGNRRSLSAAAEALQCAAGRWNAGEDSDLRQVRRRGKGAWRCGCSASELRTYWQPLLRHAAVGVSEHATGSCSGMRSSVSRAIRAADSNMGMTGARQRPSSADGTTAQEQEQWEARRHCTTAGRQGRAAHTISSQSTADTWHAHSAACHCMPPLARFVRHR
jgi:hypothetical protein